MDRKMKREFVCVLSNVENPGPMMKALTVCDGCRVTEYEGTITIACQTIGGLARISNLCAINQGENSVNHMMRQVADEIVEFIG